MKLKKMMALLLALVMVLALAACSRVYTRVDTNDGGESSTTDTSASGDSAATNSSVADNSAATNSSVVGKWEAELVMDGGLMGIDGFDGEFQICVVWEFDDDGDYELSVDEDKLHNSIADLEDALTQYMKDMLYSTFEMMGLDEEQADTAMVEQYDMTVAEYARSNVEKMDIENAIHDQVDSLSEDGEYRVEDSKIYVKVNGEKEELCFDFTIDGGKMELRSDNDDFNSMLETFGLDALVMERI